MLRALEKLIKGLLRVPPEPARPSGAAGSLRLFRAARGFFRYRLLGWGISQTGALIGIVVGAILAHQFIPRGFWKAFLALEGVAVVFFLVQLPISFLMIVLDYKYRWYMVTDRSLRVREGLLKVQERTMTFSNIQNVSIRQGPMQRLFGISDVEVRTAGGGDAHSGGGNQHGGSSDNLHLGYFRGVDNAGEIRDTILSHLKRLRSAGLGDPDEAELSSPAPVSSKVSPPAGDDLLEAGRQVLAEARALRRAVAN